MNVERWLPIDGYEAWEVSDHGRVRSLSRTIIDSTGKHRAWTGRVLKPGHTGTGYLAVSLGRQVTNLTIHRLVAATFIGPCPEGMEVCHIDGDKLNNHVDNLRYGSRSENMRDQLRHGTHGNGSRMVCRNGHPLVGDNVRVYQRARGGAERRCVTCKNIGNRRYKQRNIAARSAA